MYDTHDDMWIPHGWKCPQCGRIYSPSTPMCWYCGKEEITNQPTTTGKPTINWAGYISGGSTLPVSLPDTESWKNFLLTDIEPQSFLNENVAQQLFSDIHVDKNTLSNTHI